MIHSFQAGDYKAVHGRVVMCDSEQRDKQIMSYVMFESCDDQCKFSLQILHQLYRSLSSLKATLNTSNL